jgi:hypothetical protein
MAIFHLDIQPLSRSTGRRATAAAAYRAGERLVDERTGSVHDHSDRTDVVHRDIVLPAKFSGTHIGWARDRQQLWNAAERAELRRDARIAREYSVALPHELSAPQRLALTTAFAREIADRYGVAVDVSIHGPRADGDPRNHHAHLLSSTRELAADGFGAKTGLDMSSTVRQKRRLVGGIAELKALRACWAALTNEALREARLEVRVDHRTLVEQGIERAPRHLPWHVYKHAQQAVRSEVVAHTRALYEQRVAGSGTAGWPAEPGSLEEIRRRAPEAWLGYRAKDAAGGRGAAAEAGAERAREPAHGLGRDGLEDDAAL